ncbi:MAG: PIN domain-containing protein [Actinomycetota bacterium]|nr:PIN domain-containing protein [Actinomycetota bacterium]
MTLVLDSGGISMLAGQRARLQELRRRQEWPPIVPAAVLVEALTGDHRRDFQENQLLRMCAVEAVDEGLARDAARLRTAAGRTRTPSAVDAIVVARADRAGGSAVLTTDPDDLRALALHTTNPVRISTG